MDWRVERLAVQLTKRLLNLCVVYSLAASVIAQIAYFHMDPTQNGSGYLLPSGLSLMSAIISLVLRLRLCASAAGSSTE